MHNTTLRVTSGLRDAIQRGRPRIATGRFLPHRRFMTVKIFTTRRKIVYYSVHVGALCRLSFQFAHPSVIDGGRRPAFSRPSDVDAQRNPRVGALADDRTLCDGKALDVAETAKPANLADLRGCVACRRVEAENPRQHPLGPRKADRHHSRPRPRRLPSAVDRNATGYRVHCGSRIDPPGNGADTRRFAAYGCQPLGRRTRSQSAVSYTHLRA